MAYLVQDYEAGFNAWSTDYALARSSLYAGFTMVVNSRPLYDYILKMDEISINPSLVFAPRLDVNRLERAVSVRSKGNTQSGPLVMFYGRPSKPRNLFSIGCASLMAANKILLAQGVAANFVSAGESHQSVRALNFELESRGKLSWDSYFALLAQTDVVLSLQHSPHPSHPPLDAVCSGAWAVTNEMDGTRAGLHPRLLTSLADPDALASSVVDAVLCAMSSPAVEYDAGFLDVLGRPFDSVLDDFAGHFDASAGA
ncbi:hypothetical protein R4P64_24105 [Rhodococcus sp. IEGM 1366]|nr:hypothetical protein [Rhodococcus sp. IEGM 1366]MDV8069617.1 hypothetical protein [Rhodococcus sp. IEGM 1366]